MTEMKTLTLNGVTYEIVDAKARAWIGDLSAMETDAPDLVSAINEALQNSGGSAEIDAAEVQRIVAEYLSAHPPDAGEPGKPGADGKDGVDGKDGADGVSPTVTIEAIDGGYRITFTDADGPQAVELLHGKDGVAGKDGAPGAPGADGYSPQKGVDYFTQEDVQEIAQEASKLVTIDQVTPDQVVFPDGAQTTYAIGKVKLVNGCAELVPAGGTLEDFFNVFVDEKNPAVTQPSVQLTFSQAKAYEVGTSLTPTYSAKLSPGSYSYGPATGVTATAWEVTDTDDHTLATASGSFPALTIADDTSYKITAKASYEDGAVPVTNLGKEYAAGQIKAGSKQATSLAITGYRNSFYGTMAAKDEITSDIIRGLSGVSGASLSNGSSFDIPVPVGAMRVVIAYPATLRDISSVKDVNGMSAEISSSFVPQTVSVAGANGYQAIDYKVYTLDFANANDTANTFTATI